MLWNTSKRIARRVLHDGDHLLWVGSTINGHPSIKYGGRCVMVRRLMWEQKNGQLEGRLDLICNRPNCVNPDHCAPHLNKPAKIIRLTHEQRAERRQEIRMLRGCEKREVVAMIYGLHPDYISQVWT